MSGAAVLLGAFGALFLLMFAGFPIAFAMGVVGVAGFAAVVGWGPAIATVGQVAVDTAMNYSFSALPLFVVMGALFARARMADDLYRASYAFVGHRRGGLAMATILACGAFSTVSGSSLACAGTMTRVAVPIMRRYGYHPSFAAGTVAVGATLDILIPPSTAMVIYAVITEVDLGRLMIAGFMPGLLTVALYLAVIVGVTAWRPHLGPAGERTGWRERIRSLGDVWALGALFGGVLGGIYFGVFTPTEAAGIGSFGAFVVALLRRRLTPGVMLSLLVETLRATTALFMVLMGALLFANLITVVGGATALDQWVSSLDLGRIGLITVLVLIYIVLGCILEGTVMLLLTIPIFFPIVTKAGIDPIWFGIFVVIMGGVALIHPPLGMLLYVVRALVPDIRMNDIFRGVLPFMAADLTRLVLLIAFPGIVLFLPRLM